MSLSKRSVQIALRKARTRRQMDAGLPKEDLTQVGTEGSPESSVIRIVLVHNVHSQGHLRTEQVIQEIRLKVQGIG